MLGNINSFKHYFKKPAAIIIIAFIVSIGVTAFVIPGNSNGRQKPLDLSDTMQNASLTIVAEMKKTEPGTIVSKLESNGIDVLNTNQTIKEIAALNRTNPRGILSIIFEKS